LNITSTQLAKRVEKWQKHLAPLGIGHWNIESVNLVDETPADVGAQATVGSHSLYDNCIFWFTHSFIEEATERELDETIVHEWLHVAMRSFDQAITSVEDSLAPAVNDQWHSWVHHEREGLVERLALLICSFTDVN
jgi:hypothetical protein